MIAEYRAIGRRQAGALVVLWSVDPQSVRGAVLGFVLEPGGNNTHMRRALAALVDRGLIVSTYVGAKELGPLALPYRLTDVGRTKLREHLRRNHLHIMEGQS